jgi:hypothetical protein
MVNRDFHELYLQVKEKRPELRILIGLKSQPPLLKDGRRPSPSPIERLQTLFQRRPNIDLTAFFYSLTNSNDEISDGRITDHAQLKQALQEVIYRIFIIFLIIFIVFIIESQCSIY